MTEKLVRFIKARLDEEADLARRCDSDDGCGTWTTQGHTVDFCQADLSGFHPTIALHVALHDPARILHGPEAAQHTIRGPSKATPSTERRSLTSSCMVGGSASKAADCPPCSRSCAAGRGGLLMWGRRYPAIVRLRENAWEEFTPLLRFDTEIRRILCATKAIDSVNVRAFADVGLLKIAQ
ncbi:DUF6221 family protein [[Kitasatospora] papulosa]|uniref:DUF6221 family protein n=1 Tax=[Kitasatospora] papulosa TaxID=1464011 RepID=UPI003696B1DB